jgi:hypothetical protein
MGEEFPEAWGKNQQGYLAIPKKVSLKVGEFEPNPWGLYDMHGNVEEWCRDWYNPHADGDITDPLGAAPTDCRVTRGGSHNTETRYMDSADRHGMMPEARNWLIGFRVVQGELPETTNLPAPDTPLCMRDVSQDAYDWAAHAPDVSEPYFARPREYVIKPHGNHNHQPSITWCPNGDLLAIWYVGWTEVDRDLRVTASRLRAGADAWEPASEFFHPENRNAHGSAVFHDGKGTLYHFNGVSAAAHYRNCLALVLRKSRDNGATWSRAELVNPEFGPGNQVIGTPLVTDDGDMIVLCDDTGPTAAFGSNLYLSTDGGKTWADPRGDWDTPPELVEGGTGHTIAGIHAGIVQLDDGRLLAMGRGQNIDDKMPLSISDDMGKTWTYHTSPFPPVGGGQRLALLKLREGPMMLASFDNDGWTLTDASGTERKVKGLFTSISEDGGKTWSTPKLVTPGGDFRRMYNGQAWTKQFLLDAHRGEPKGYLAATQTPDGVIHLISSGVHYAFNLAWLKAPARPSLPPLAPVGVWREEHFTEGERTTLRFDVTERIEKPGKYQVTFTYRFGPHGVHLHRVSLLADGKVVSTDKHGGWAGGAPSNTSFMVELDEVREDGEYVLEAEMGGGAVQTNGDVDMYPMTP